MQIFVLILLALDRCGFLNVLHRPLIACTLIGAASGNAAEGIKVGLACELMYFGLSHIYGNEDGGTLLFSIAAVAAASASKIDPSAAAAAGLAGLFAGHMIDRALESVSSLLVPSARKAAQERKEGTLGVLNLIPMILGVIVYVLLGNMLLSEGGASLLNSLLSGPAAWILVLSFVGILLQCLGLAVVLRNIGAKSEIGFVLAGAAAGLALLGTSVSSAALAAAGMAAFGIAAAYYGKDGGKTPAQTETKKGGADKWW